MLLTNRDLNLLMLLLVLATVIIVKCSLKLMGQVKLT